MLEQLRQQSSSFIIWILFGIIIAAFVLFFGPQSSGDLGCGASKSFVLRVDDRDIDSHSWRFAMNGLGLGSGSGDDAESLSKRYQGFDALVERALLANAARASGFTVSDELVTQNIKDGELFIMGQKLQGQQYYFTDGYFDYDRYKLLANNLGVPSVELMFEQQREETLAHMARLMFLNADISREEAETRFIQQKTTVSLDYVFFETGKYQTGLNLSPDQIASYLAAHEADVKSRYDADAATYKGVSAQVRARHILIKSEPSDDESDAGEEKAKALRAKLEGGADFAETAKQASEDARTKAKGGDLGWRPVDSLGFGPELVEAAKGLEEGVLSDVIKTAAGYHILRIDGKREGDLAFDVVKNEIAEKLARDYYGSEGARLDAEAALAKVGGGSTLAELYGKKEPPPTPPGDVPTPSLDKKNDQPEDADDDAKDDTTGWLIRESGNVPASLGAVAQASSGTTEVIPRPEGLEPPELKSAGPMPRSGDYIAGLGEAPDIINDAFSTLEVGKPPSKVYKTDRGFVLVELKARSLADLDEFKEAEADTIRGMAMQKGVDALVAWLQSECRNAANNNKILLNQQFLANEDGTPPVVPYAPCSTISSQSVIRQVFSYGGF